MLETSRLTFEQIEVAWGGENVSVNGAHLSINRYFAYTVGQTVNKENLPVNLVFKVKVQNL